MNESLTTAHGSTTWLPIAVLILVLLLAVIFMGVRARSQHRQQALREQVVLADFADLHEIAELAEQDWAKPLLRALHDDSSAATRNLWQHQLWQGILRGTYRDRPMLSATTTRRHVLLVELAPASATAAKLTIEPSASTHRRAKVDTVPASDAPAAAAPTVEFGDSALSKSWVVQCADPVFAQAVIDIAMRGRLFGIDARDMHLVAVGRALAASFPEPATAELIRDRAILLTEFAERLELHAGNDKSRSGRSG